MLQTLILIFFLINISFNQYSPLLLNIDGGVTITRQSSTEHAIVYPISRLATLNTIFCLASTTMNLGANNTATGVTSCTLSLETLYTCIRLFNDQNGLNFEKTEGIDLTNKLKLANENLIKPQSSKNFRRVLQTTLSLNIRFESISNQQKIIFNSSNLHYKIAHLVSCQNYINLNSDLGDCDFWKSNYVQFFTPNFAGNIITQRYHACGIKSEKQVHVFYGGVIRQSQPYLILGVVSYDRSNSSLNMWGAIDYSNDHASRDMFCYNSKGQNFDAISFIAGAPYSDINSVISGENNVYLISNSYSESYVNPPSSHFIQYYRKYDTGDRASDEEIFSRIYGVFSFAGYFSNNSTATLSCLNSTQKHTMVFQFVSYIDLVEAKLQFQMLLIILLLATLLR